MDDDSFTRELEASLANPTDGANGIDLADEDILPLDGESLLTEDGPQPGGRFVSSVADEEARDASLRAELESVRRVNALITSVNKSLQDALGNMAVHETTSHLYVVLEL